jgi:methylthioxylose transferase
MTNGRLARMTDRGAALLAVALVALAAVTGGVLYLTGHPVLATSAPLTGAWLPHVGPGTVPAIAIAALVVWHSQALAAVLPWRRLLAAGYATTVGWIIALATVDGWQRGVAGRLTTKHEYLSEVGGVTDVPAMLRGFTGRILDFQPDSWTTHVSGHPPGALLVFVGLDRIGLGGGAWAALLCIAIGALITVAIPVTLRAVGDEETARAAVPFLVLFPGAVWIGVSADGLFAGFCAIALALLAVALTRDRPWLAAVSGLLLGNAIFLSYGLTLLAVPALAIVVLCRRRFRPVTLAAAAAGAVLPVAGFAAAGFWWVDGYHLVVERYYQGIAADRPYAYWVWANLALVVLSAGPAAAPILRRAVAAPRTALLPLAALAAILAADLSGLSKAEVERIWLPFTVWLVAGAALLPAPGRRFWLIVQAATALLVNPRLLTTW